MLAHTPPGLDLRVKRIGRGDETDFTLEVHLTELLASDRKGLTIGFWISGEGMVTWTWDIQLVPRSASHPTLDQNLQFEHFEVDFNLGKNLSATVARTKPSEGYTRRGGYANFDPEVRYFSLGTFHLPLPRMTIPPGSGPTFPLNVPVHFPSRTRSRLRFNAGSENNLQANSLGSHDRSSSMSPPSTGFGAPGSTFWFGRRGKSLKKQRDTAERYRKLMGLEEEQAAATRAANAANADALGHQRGRSLGSGANGVSFEDVTPTRFETSGRLLTPDEYFVASGQKDRFYQQRRRKRSKFAASRSLGSLHMASVSGDLPRDVTDPVLYDDRERSKWSLDNLGNHASKCVCKPFALDQCRDSSARGIFGFGTARAGLGAGGSRTTIATERPGGRNGYIEEEEPLGLGKFIVVVSKQEENISVRKDDPAAAGFVSRSSLRQRPTVSSSQSNVTRNNTVTANTGYDPARRSSRSSYPPQRNSLQHHPTGSSSRRGQQSVFNNRYSTVETTEVQNGPGDHEARRREFERLNEMDRIQRDRVLDAEERQLEQELEAERRGVERRDREKERDQARQRQSELERQKLLEVEKAARARGDEERRRADDDRRRAEEEAILAHQRAQREREEVLKKELSERENKVKEMEERQRKMQEDMMRMQRERAEMEQNPDLVRRSSKARGYPSARAQEPTDVFGSYTMEQAPDARDNGQEAQGYWNPENGGHRGPPPQPEYQYEQSQQPQGPAPGGGKPWHQGARPSAGVGDRTSRQANIEAAMARNPSARRPLPREMNSGFNERRVASGANGNGGAVGGRGVGVGVGVDRNAESDVMDPGHRPQTRGVGVSRNGSQHYEGEGGGGRKKGPGVHNTLEDEMAMAEQR